MGATTRTVTAAISFVAAVVAVGAMWLPWFTSGSAGRNSFAMFRAAQLLGIESITPFRVLWFLLPVVLLAAAALFVFGLQRSASAALVVLGAALVAVGWVAFSAVGAHVGSAAATAGGLCTIVFAIPGLSKLAV